MTPCEVGPALEKCAGVTVRAAPCVLICELSRPESRAWSRGAERGCFEAVSGLLAPTKAGKEVLEDRVTFRGHLGIVLILQLRAG